MAAAIAVVIVVVPSVPGETAGAQADYPPDIPVASTLGPLLQPPTAQGLPVPFAGAGTPSATGPAVPSIPTGAVPTTADRPVVPGGQNGRLELRPPSVHPGQLPVARGDGCGAFGGVTLRVDGAPLPSTTADAQGRFETVVSLPSLPPGRHRVVAECGGSTLEGTVDVVLPVTSGVPLAGLAGAAAVLCFFALVVLLTEDPQGRTRRTWSVW